MIESVVDAKNWATSARGGDLGKPISPGAKARTDARKSSTTGARSTKESRSNRSSFVEGCLQNPSRRSRPAAANRLVQKFRPGGQAGENGFFGRFSTRPTPNPHNPGCAGGPRSITVRSGQQNQSEYQPDGYSKEQILMFEENPRYSELAKNVKQILNQKKKLVRFYKLKMKVWLVVLDGQI